MAHSPRPVSWVANPSIPARFTSTADGAPEFEKDSIDMVTQMMYVSGETGEPSAETTGMIEEIVRQQVVEIVSAAA